jgi:PHD/YefM family antitoxin component YafN of YafNO toxin-antitoxin module
MPQIRPITDLRNTNDISELCHLKKEPVFITKNGYGDLVIMSIETYEQIVENVGIDEAIMEAEAEYKREGKLIDAKEALSSLKRRYFE